MNAFLLSGDSAGAQFNCSEIIKEHILAKTKYLNGDVLGCLEVLRPHENKKLNIAFLSDLLLCYFELGHGPHYLHYLEKVEAELKLCERKVNCVSFAKVKFNLSHIYEEVGELDKALNHLKDIANRKGMQPDYIIIAQAQILRIKTIYSEKSLIKREYLELKNRISQSDLGMNYFVLKSLILCELHLLEPSEFLGSFKKVVNNSKLSVSERSELAFELLANAFESTKEKREIIEYIKQNQAKLLLAKDSADDFLLRKVVMLEPLEQSDLIKLHHECSLGRFLRIARYIETVDPDWIFFLISGFSSASQRLWRTSFSFLKKEVSGTTIYVSDQKVISERGGQIDLRRKKNLAKIIELFVEQRSWKKIELIEKLWEVTEPNESYEERLRLAFRRVNQDFVSIMGLPILEAKGDSYGLIDQIQLTKR